MTEMPGQEENYNPLEEIRSNWEPPLRDCDYTVIVSPLESPLTRWQHPPGIANERVPPDTEGTLVGRREKDDIIVIRPIEIRSSDKGSSRLKVLNDGLHNPEPRIEESVYVTPGSKYLPPKDLLSGSLTELEIPERKVTARRVTDPDEFHKYLKSQKP